MVPFKSLVFCSVWCEHEANICLNVADFFLSVVLSVNFQKNKDILEKFQKQMNFCVWILFWISLILFFQ